MLRPPKHGELIMLSSGNDIAPVSVKTLAVVLESRYDGYAVWLKVMTVDGKVGWIFDCEAKQL